MGEHHPAQQVRQHGQHEHARNTTQHHPVTRGTTNDWYTYYRQTSNIIRTKSHLNDSRLVL